MAPTTGKRKRIGKRQRLSTTEVRPIGVGSSTADDKDDEERQLENILFGVPFTKGARRGKQKAIEESPLGNSKQTTSAGLDHILDSELFFFDDGESSSGGGAPKASAEDAASDASAEEFGGIVDQAASDDNLIITGDDDRPAQFPNIPNPTPVFAPKSKPITASKKGPAWIDPSDKIVTVSLKDDTRLRKLRDGPEDDRVTGREYELKLRRQFERINPTPAWTAAAREKLHNPQRKRRRPSSSSASGSNAGDGVEDLLHSTGDILSQSDRPKLLPPTKLDILGLRDANQTAHSDGEIRSVRFHPSPTVPVLLTAGSDRRLRLFNIDGLTNPLLQTVHTPTLPITNAQFHPSGQSILMTGDRPYFSTYDLQSGTTSQSPRGLWSSLSFTNDGNDAGDRSMGICKFSDDGKMLAVGGRNGYVHLLHCGAGGTASAQVVGGVKMNRPLKDLEWMGGIGKELMTVSGEGQVFLWDVGSRRCLRTWTDESAYGSTALARGGAAGRYFAIGSKTGIVNVYGAEAGSTLSTSAKVAPLKAIQNLLHPISTLRFDPSCQILALASKYKRAQLRMVHLPSLTVFANWPTANTPLGTVMSLDFSAGSEYLAIGNAKGRVLLYNLKHFGAR